MAPVAHFLVEELADLRRRSTDAAPGAESDWSARAEDAAERVALAVHLLGRIESAAGKGRSDDPAEWDESAARSFIPIFRDWFEWATTVREMVRACREHGHRVEGVEEFLHGYNRAKMMAVDFDSLVESLRRIERGESRGTPLEEVRDELHRRAGAQRGG